MSYQTLNTYSNNGGLKFAGNNIPTATASSGYYLVPDYGNIGYDALTNSGGPSGNKYFTIKDAYGKNSNESCGTKYNQSACSK